MSKLIGPLPRERWPDFKLFRPYPSAEWLASALRDSHARTRELIAHLDDGNAVVPMIAIVNPPLWEIGHVAWFQEFWMQRRGDFAAPARLPRADALYDSSSIPHDDRWTLPLPDLAGTLRYLGEVLEASLTQLASDSLDEETAYFALLSLYHQDMHNEAFSYTWHTLGWALPGARHDSTPPRSSDLECEGGVMQLGPSPGSGFVFDNEKWAREVTLAPFRIAARVVTNAAYRDFVDDGGYQRREFWSDAGWAAREREHLAHPRYWRPAGGAVHHAAGLDHRSGNVDEFAGDAVRWQVRQFDRWVPLPAEQPVRHISGLEADAYCRWAKRRLPTEAEWEFAATRCPEKFHQGEVWEWTASRFLPYPGFAPDPYQDYSAPWFVDEHRVLRGGSFVTPRRMMRPTFRNFYNPARADMFCGFRTCALD
jgi:gamma-glutamyl hercynylcysteine S-oxide synthase